MGKIFKCDFGVTQFLGTNMRHSTRVWFAEGAELPSFENQGTLRWAILGTQKLMYQYTSHLAQILPIFPLHIRLYMSISKT